MLVKKKTYEPLTCRVIQLLYEESVLTGSVTITGSATIDDMGDEESYD